MNSRQRHEFYLENIPGYNQTAEDIIQNIVNRLLEALYIPVRDVICFKADEVRLELFGIYGGEPINWGDLKCIEVKKFEDGTFLVTIEEAAPKECPTLCEYLETYIKFYGWIIKVETEW